MSGTIFTMAANCRGFCQEWFTRPRTWTKSTEPETKNITYPMIREDLLAHFLGNNATADPRGVWNEFAATRLKQIATLFSPFRVFLPVSAFFFFAGVGYYLYAYITERRFTNMAVILLTTAVIIFMLGLVSEQIALLRMEQRSVRSGAKIEDQDE